MAQASSPSIQSIKDRCGLTDDDLEYLTAVGFKNLLLLSRAAADNPTFITRVVTPYVNGVTIDGKEYKTNRLECMVEATLVVAFEEAQKWRRSDLSDPAPQASQPPAASGELKAPTSLPPGEFQRLVRKWETQWQPPREFPVKMLQGADYTLARLRFEHAISRSFSPLGLTEILQGRIYNADGSINLKRVEKPKTEGAIRTNASGFLVADRESEDAKLPDSKFDATDALESVAWALKWAEYAKEPAIENFLIWTKGLLRSSACNAKNFAVLFQAISWKIATAMSAGESWTDASADLIADREWLADAKERYLKADKVRDDREQGPLIQLKERGRSPQRRAPLHDPRRGRPSRENNDRRGDYRRDRAASRSPRGPRRASPKKNAKGKDWVDMPRSRSRGGTRICRNYNRGNCKKASSCKFAHECANCGEKSCNASKCQRKTR